MYFIIKLMKRIHILHWEMVCVYWVLFIFVLFPSIILFIFYIFFAYYCVIILVTFNLPHFTLNNFP